MIDVPIHDRQGKVLETVQFDDTCLGKFINMQALHRAIVTYEANQRLGTASTKAKRALQATRKKPYRQKGTGRARMGHRRRVGSVGGAACHGPVPRDHSKSMPKKERRIALRSALLGKFRDGEVIVVNELNQAEPKTREMATTLKAVKAETGCLVVSYEPSDTLYKSVRNIPAADVTTLKQLNAYTILSRKNLVITKAVLEALPTEMK